MLLFASFTSFISHFLQKHWIEHDCDPTTIDQISTSDDQ